jgi:hypothetical protein
LICAEFIRKTGAKEGDSSKKSKKGAVDFQLFLPVLLTIFHRESKGIRKAGLECLAAILECYAGVDKSSSNAASIYAEGKFYGSESGM